MNEYTTVIGLDLSDKTAEFCVLDWGSGEFLERGTLTLTQEAVRRKFEGMEDTLVVFETGTHSPWLQHTLEDLGLTVVVAHARSLKVISQSDHKSDRRDAEMLARLVRADLNLFTIVSHRGIQEQADLCVIKSRDKMVQARSKLINCVRGMVKAFGARIDRCSPESFAKRALPQVPQELRPAAVPLLEQIGNLTLAIREHERKIEHMCKQKYPETAHLLSVQGIGPVTALAFHLVLEHPERFHSRDVGSYVGLTPKLSQSGQSNPQLRISKSGNPLLRRLLVQCAHYILTRGQDSELRRWGLAIAARYGKKGRKRAAVAVARKLAVLLHVLWKTKTYFDPFPPKKQSKRARATAKARASKVSGASTMAPPSRPPQGGKRQPGPHGQAGKNSPSASASRPARKTRHNAQPKVA